MKTKAIRYLFLALIVLSHLAVSSQNEGKKWYFGYGTGLDFMTASPSTIAVSSMSTQEGCASIADAGGNLLMYTDGVTLWDRTHAVMANGSGLLGSTLSSQSSLILQKPGSSTLYYVFTNVGFNIPNVPNVNYSIVDITLASGNGSVVTKNSVLSADQNTEVLAATRHCNGIDWWIVVHIRNSNAYVAFLLTATGISPSFVVSPAGPNILSGFSQLKFSPNGKKIALSFNGTVFLGDFDAATGIVSSVTTIQTSSSGYGCEFSSDGGKLYTTASNGIVQYDLCQSTPAAIASSSFYVYSQNAAFGSMQLAPNGKIYLSYNTFTTNCQVINNPNVYGSGCGFATASHTFSPKVIHAGLPNFPSCLFYQKPTLAPYFYAVSSSLGCYGAYFNAILLSSSCAAISNSLAMLVWDFDDPVSGANNISYLVSPTHNFSGNGVYNVKLILHYTCGFASDTIAQLVTINDNCLTYLSNSITCANPGSATITSAVGNGPFTYTWLPGTQTGPIANTITPGSHTVVVNDGYTNYTYSVPLFFPSLSAYTGSIVATNSVGCYGGTTGSGAISNIVGGSGSQNYLWTNGTQVSTAQNPNNLTAGSWTVTITDALTACLVNSVISLPQAPPLTLTAVSSATACNGAPVVLSATNAGGTPFPLTGYTYTWTNAPPSPTAQVTERLVGSHVYTVSSKDSHNCLATTTLAVNVISNPVLAIANTSVCPQNNGTLIGNGASTYTWITPAASNLVSTTLVDNPTVTTQYTVVGSVQGCTTAATASIVLHPLPIASFQTNSPGCEGGSVSFSVSGADTYQWTGPSSFVSSTAGNVLSNLNLNQAGAYVTTLTSVNGCTNTASLNIVVNPAPPVSAIGSTVCTTQTITLIGNSVPGATYFWSGPIGYFSNSQNPTIPNPNTARSGTYVVRATAATGCTNAAFAVVSVIPPPNLFLSLSGKTVCAQALSGSSNTIVLSAAGANTYTLHASASLGTSSAPGNNMTLFSLPPYLSVPSAVTGTLEGSNGICSSLAPFVFTVIPNPVVSILSSTPSICAGESLTLNCVGASSYTWSANAINYNINSTGSSLVANPSTGQALSVYGASLGCRSAATLYSITVNPLPTLTLSAVNTSICLHEKTLLTAKGNGQSFQWIPNIGLSAINTQTVYAQPLSTQGYTLTATANNCSKTSTLLLSVLALPSPTITKDRDKVCVNDSIHFYGEGGVSYEWLGPNNFGVSGQKVSYAAKSIQFGESYTLTVTDVNGCRNSSITMVPVVALPSGFISDFNKDDCVPYCHVFEFSGYNSNSIVSDWTINKTDYAGNRFNVCLSEPGTYTLSGRLQDLSTSCKANLSYVLNLHAKPKAGFTVAPQKPIERIDELQFTNTSSGDNIVSYKWYFDDLSESLVKSKNTTRIYEDAGTYVVAMVVENMYACKDTMTRPLVIASDFALYVPNTFTPNDDNFNDVFLPVARAIKSYDLKVYDRWGHERFHSKSLESGWDGRFSGELCKQDVYTWVIEVSTNNGDAVKRSGTVTLLR